MNTSKIPYPLSHGRRLPNLLIAIFLTISLGAGIMSSVARTQTVQTILFLDLGAAASPAALQLLGANAEDHLSGSGAPGSFSGSGRAHAIAVGDFNKDGF